MEAKIFSNDSNRIVEATKGFVAQDPKRRLHKFIRMEFCASDSSVIAVAVDGRKMSVEHAACECDEDFVVYINASTRLPRGMDAAIEVVGSDVIIRCGDFIFGCPQKDGEFIDWRAAVPKEDASFRIGVNGNYLLTALKVAKISCGDSFKRPVVLEFRGETSPILLRTNEDDIKMVLPIRIKNRDEIMRR